MSKLHAVTGAFGYSGRYISRRLLDRGERVITITGHPAAHNPFGDAVQAYPFNFDHPDALAETLDGIDTLFNTYWIRFPYAGMTFEEAVENTKAMFDAAQRAGVRRVVHVSIANPAPDSVLPYYRGKAEMERYLHESGLRYAILRPTVLFGVTPGEDVLINNIAWLLRYLPVFGVPGDGEYNIQPVHVEDLAALAVEHGMRSDNVTLDAVGPETFTFKGLVRLIREKICSQALIINVDPRLALGAAKVMGQLMGDVMLTRNEIIGLMAGLLQSFEEPTGSRYLSAWLERHAQQLGVKYASEVDRHYD